MKTLNLSDSTISLLHMMYQDAVDDLLDDPDEMFTPDDGDPNALLMEHVEEMKLMGQEIGFPFEAAVKQSSFSEGTLNALLAGKLSPKWSRWYPDKEIEDLE